MEKEERSPPVGDWGVVVFVSLVQIPATMNVALLHQLFRIGPFRVLGLAAVSILRSLNLWRLAREGNAGLGTFGSLGELHIGCRSRICRRISANIRASLGACPAKWLLKKA